jgi:beta propeller repeat protein
MRMRGFAVPFLILLGLPAGHAQEPSAGPVRQLTTSPGPQFDPAISDNIVVFTDSRNGNDDVYYIDLLTGIETQLTTATTPQRLHDVDGTRIVYTDLSSLSMHIMLFDIVTGVTRQLTAGPRDQNPRIDGTTIVFERGPPAAEDVISYDILTDEMIPVAATSASERNASISGHRVAYQRHAAGAPGDIVLFDLATGQETALAETPLDERFPDIDGDVVVWEVTNPETGRDIAIHNLATGVTTVLERPGDQGLPHVSGQLVSFDDYDSPGGSAVMLYHIPSSRIFEGDARPGTAQFLNDISGNRVSYTSNETGNLDIWLLEIPDVDVSPRAFGFGSVAVGQQLTTIVTASNVGAPLLTVRSAAPPALDGAPFSVTDVRRNGVAASLPVTLGPEDTLDIEVAYQPTSDGSHSGSICVESDDLQEAVVCVALSGTGVSTPPPVQQQIGDLLAFFDGVVNGGTLWGDGAGHSAAGRRNALRNMLVATGDLLAQGRLAEACQQALDGWQRTDGFPRPPDFVAGPAAAELAERIEALRTAMGCP